MRKSDILWGAILVIITLLFTLPWTREFMLESTKQAPYFMGFIKTSILATMGELLAYRIRTKSYRGLLGLPYKAIIWGFLGMGFVLVFPIFASGVAAAADQGLLFQINNSKLLLAFWISLWMNLIFAPTFMLLHRITDTWIELGQGCYHKMKTVRLIDIVKNIDFHRFFHFTLFKTIPFFWIPAHTITFLLIPEYRVLMAAYLSILLGVLLSFKKKETTPKEDTNV